MGLTVSRKAAKNLAVRRKNERILTVSRKKILTVKISNHKIRSRDLLLSQDVLCVHDTLVPRAFLRRGEDGREKALASAGHMTHKTPRNCGCNKLA